MHEFLVEVTPGRERVYSTPSAFRAAIRSGEITPDSRVYHRAASRWLSIMEHPEYRRFLAERRPPDWLEPIPFQPSEPRAAAAGGLATLRTTLGRVRSWIRARLARRAARPRAAAAAGPRESVDQRSPPPLKRWTFYP